MSYIGKTPTPAPLTSSDITDGIISTSKLADTSVTNAKLNADLISAETELATSPADTDELLISDAGVLKRIDASLVGGSAGLNKIVTNTVSSAHDYINIDSCFSSTYENYLIVGTAELGFNTNMGIRVRASGSTASGSLYSRNVGAIFSSTYTDAGNSSYIAMSYNDLINIHVNWFFYIFRPQLAEETYVVGQMTSANLHSTNFAGRVNTTSQYDGIQIYNVNTGSGDLSSSKVTIYGLEI